MSKGRKHDDPSDWYPRQTTKIDPAALAGPELVVSARIWAFILVKSVFELCIGAAVNRGSTSENPDLKKKTSRHLIFIYISRQKVLVLMLPR